jgi:hypothetical protein
MGPRVRTPSPRDTWIYRTRFVRGTTGFDGLERISTQTLMDMLEAMQRKCTAGAYRYLASLMAEFGWAPVRLRDFNGRGSKRRFAGTSGALHEWGANRVGKQGSKVKLLPAHVTHYSKTNRPCGDGQDEDDIVT